LALIEIRVSGSVISTVEIRERITSRLKTLFNVIRVFEDTHSPRLLVIAAGGDKQDHYYHN